MLFKVGNRESVKYYQKQRQEYINHGKCFDGRGIKNAFLNGFLLGIKEVLEKQCTALMVVIPEEVEKKYKDRTSKFHRFNASFKVKVNNRGDLAKSEGVKVGKNVAMSRSIETSAK